MIERKELKFKYIGEKMRENRDKKESTDPLEYYSQHSDITNPKAYSHLFSGLPTTVPELCRVVQNNFVHLLILKYNGKKAYGITMEDLQEKGRNLKEELNMVTIEEKLKIIYDIKSSPLTTKRSPVEQILGNCRDFALLLCSFLRHRGIPARVRSGCAKYLNPGQEFYEDHYVTEYWHTQENRWILVDSQIDEFQHKFMKITIDVHDVPKDEFVVGGEAWKWYRTQKINPEKFGIFDFTGPHYIRYKLVNDLAFLNKEETMAWGGWGLGVVGDEKLSPKDYALLDYLAEVATRTDNKPFEEIRRLYKNPLLRKPDNWQCPVWFFGFEESGSKG